MHMLAFPPSSLLWPLPHCFQVLAFTHNLCVTCCEPRRNSVPFTGFHPESPLAPHKERVERAFPKDRGIAESQLPHLSCPFPSVSSLLHARPDLPQEVQAAFPALEALGAASPLSLWSSRPCISNDFPQMSVQIRFNDIVKKKTKEVYFPLR